MNARSAAVRRWLRFNAVGALGILVQLAALALFTRLLGWNYLVATAAAVETAVVHNFVWHERWTWAERPVAGAAATGVRLARFHLANGAVSCAGNLLLMRLFTGVFGMDVIAANLVAITVCSVMNFLAAEHVVFTQPRGGPDALRCSQAAAVTARRLRTAAVMTPKRPQNITVQGTQRKSWGSRPSRTNLGPSTVTPGGRAS